jgi:hypothetical protein
MGHNHSGIRRYGQEVTSASGASGAWFSEYPLHNWRCELSYHGAGIWGAIDAASAVHFVAEILAVADRVDGISGGPADWPDAAFFGIL